MVCLKQEPPITPYTLLLEGRTNIFLETEFAITALAHVWILIILASVFKELQKCMRHDKKSGAPHFPKFHEKKGNRFSIAELPGDMELPTDSKSHKKMKAHTVSAGRNKIRKMLEKTRFSILPPKPFRYGLGSQKHKFDLLILY